MAKSKAALSGEVVKGTVRVVPVRPTPTHARSGGAHWQWAAGGARVVAQASIAPRGAARQSFFSYVVGWWG